MARNPYYVLGVDLGQTNDYTAIAVLEYEHGDEPTYDVRHAQRFPLGTRYPDLVDRIVSRVNEPPLRGRTMIAADATGVGPPVIDQLRTKLYYVTVHAITITGGYSVGGSNNDPTVPKRDLIHTTQLLLQLGRLRIANNIRERDTLVAELDNYRVKLSDNTGHDSYGPWREREHDDLVLALALATWTGENKRCRPMRISSPVKYRMPEPFWHRPGYGRYAA